MGLYCVNGGASHEYEDAAAPTPPSTFSACVDRQVINGYELCKVEFPGGCADHEEPQAAAAEYCQSTFGDDWLPIGDHGYSCNNGHCIDAHIDLGHQAFNDCSAENVPYQGFALPLPGFTVPLPGFSWPLPGFAWHLLDAGVRKRMAPGASHQKSIGSHH